MERPILFFDGECGLCGRAARRILRADRRGTFAFASLQGETALRLLPAPPADRREWSMLLLDANGLRSGSDALLEVFRLLGGAWSIPALARFLPRFLREPVYRLVARNRHALSRGRASCPTPDPAWRERLLP